MLPPRTCGTSTPPPVVVINLEFNQMGHHPSPHLPAASGLGAHTAPLLYRGAWVQPPYLGPQHPPRIPTAWLRPGEGRRGAAVPGSATLGPSVSFPSGLGPGASTSRLTDGKSSCSEAGPLPSLHSPLQACRERGVPQVRVLSGWQGQVQLISPGAWRGRQLLYALPPPPGLLQTSKPNLVP